MTSEILAGAERKMLRAVEAMERDFQGFRTGRASTSLVERLTVDYYGTQTPLNQLASISVPEPHQIVIQPWDRGVLSAIEKAILKSDIGLTPNVDGTLVRLNIPPLTEERRKDIVEERPQADGGGPDRDPQHPPRGERRDQEGRARRRARHRRRAPRGRPAPEADRPRRRRRRPARAASRSRRSSRSSGAGAARSLARPSDGRAAARPRGDRRGPRRRERGCRGPAPPARGAAAARRDHHGRQPPLGAQPGQGRLRGPRGRRGGHPGTAPSRGPARRPDAHPVRVQPRELGPLRRRGRRPVRAPRPGDPRARPTSSGRRASASASWAGSRSCPTKPAQSITGALAQTAEGTRLDLNIAWNYAGRTELVDAFRRILATGVAPEEVDERTISEALYTGGLPDPDLVIRTGGEQRISNFLIWQSAYAELVFDECLWPDFGPDSFDAALLEFARRNRRFGR